MPVDSFNVLGVKLSAMDLDISVQECLKALHENRKGYVCVSTVHGISEAQKDTAFRKILNQAWLNTTDGMPLVWLGKYYVRPAVSRVYGPDLMLRLFEQTAGTEFTHFLYGGKPGVAEKLKAEMETRFPGTAIVGTFCPPFRPLDSLEERALIEQVASSRPAIFWVGLGTPKQERFMAEYLDKLDTRLMISVGAAFDFHTGQLSQAPRWMQNGGLEWFYRLCCEPRRLWRRYLIYNPLFVWRIFLQLTGLKKYPLADDSKER